MKDVLKKVKADMILSAVLCVAMGIVIFLRPAETIDVVCKVLAIGLAVLGGVELFSYFMNKAVHPFSGILGLIVLLIGIWIFLKPESIVSLIPIVIGVILAIHGIQDIRLALETKRNGYDKWWSMLIIAGISLVFGVLCIVNAFGMVKLALKFIGIALIYDGISDLWIVTRAVRTAKEMQEEADSLTVDYREVDGK